MQQKQEYSAQHMIRQLCRSHSWQIEDAQQRRPKTQIVLTIIAQKNMARSSIAKSFLYSIKKKIRSPSHDLLLSYNLLSVEKRDKYLP